MNKKKEVLQEKIIKQTWLAEKMDINRSTISKMKNEKFGITVDYLVRFSIFLDYNIKVVKR